MSQRPRKPRRPKDEITREDRILAAWRARIKTKGVTGYPNFTDELIREGDGKEDIYGPLFSDVDEAIWHQAYDVVRRAIRQHGPRGIPMGLPIPPDGITEASSVDDMLAVQIDNLDIIPEETADIRTHAFNLVRDADRACNDLFSSPVRHREIVLDTYQVDLAPLAVEVINRVLRRIGYTAVPFLEPGEVDNDKTKGDE